jgi:predicted aminopeptidase
MLAKLFLHVFRGARSRLTSHMKRGGLLVSIALAALSAGCTSLSYLRQATRGQLEIQERRVPLQVAMDDETLPQEQRMLLKRVPAIKAFGELRGIRPTDNYQEFANMHRQNLLWVVTACKPFSFEPRIWSFPIVGSITYLGFFDKQEAVAFAHTLKVESKTNSETAEYPLDIDVRPSNAFSTLGFFRDPILSTMLGEGDEGPGELADVVLHESTHATFYADGQSYLNESVAEFVGQELAIQYLRETEGESAMRTLRYEGQLLEGESRAKAMKAAYDSLDALYKQLPTLGKPKVAQEKKRILRELKVRTQMRRNPTNATLVQFRTYHGSKGILRALYRQCGSDMKRLLTFLEAQKPAIAKMKRQLDTDAIVAALPTGCSLP